MFNLDPFKSDILKVHKNILENSKKEYIPLKNTGYDGITPQKFDKSAVKYVYSSSFFDGFSPSFAKIINSRHNKKRQVYIPRYKDLIVEKSLLTYFKNILKKNKDIRFSYGFDKKGSRVPFVRQCNNLVNNGYTNMCKFDVIKFSENIDHDILLSKIKNIFKNQDIYKLLENFINQPVVMSKNRTFIKKSKNKGLCQGRPLSNFLCDLYFNNFENYVQFPKKMQVMRFVDDIYIFYNDASLHGDVHSLADRWSNKHKLQLHSNFGSKSFCCQNISKNKISILGFKLESGYIKLSDKSKAKIAQKINEICKADNINDAYKKLNNYFYGWESIKNYGDSFSKDSAILMLRTVTFPKDIIWVEKYIIWKFNNSYGQFNFSYFYSVVHIWNNLQKVKNE